MQQGQGRTENLWGTCQSEAGLPMRVCQMLSTRSRAGSGETKREGGRREATAKQGIENQRDRATTIDDRHPDIHHPAGLFSGIGRQEESRNESRAVTPSAVDIGKPFNASAVNRQPVTIAEP